MAKQKPQIVVGVSGASGAVYARRLVQCSCNSGATVHLVVTEHGKQLLNDELGITELTPSSFDLTSRDELVVHSCRDVGAQIASGSFHTDGMVICPCSMNTLGAVAGGLGANLLTRSAAVTLKESRKLIIVFREMPVSSIVLENMLRVSRAGAIVCPASPGFYMKPQTVDDLVDFVVGKTLDLLGLSHNLSTRWGGSPSSANSSGVSG